MPRISAGLRGNWGSPSPLARGFVAAVPPAVQLDPVRHAPWGPGGLQADPTRRIPWILPGVADRARRVPWLPYPHALALGTVSPWRLPLRLDPLRRVPWGVYARRIDHGRSAPWVRAAARDALLRVPWGLYRPIALDLVARVAASLPRDRTWRIIFGRYVKRYYTAIAGVNFPVEPPGIVPVQRTYIVTNVVTLIRVSDLVAVPCLGLQITFDVDSWTVGWSATVPGAALGLVEPPAAASPVALEAAINGDRFRLLVEQIQRDRQFPASRLQLSGRGISAVLAAPYADIVSRNNDGGAMTAAQIANDALTINATPIGWAIDWGLTDWLVPAGAWQHRGSHLEAVKAVAEAAGGYVRSDRIAQTLFIRPRWPVLPWDLATATPELTVPDAAVAREAIRWVERPAYDGVYVSGETSGILAHCRRTGFAGTELAPMAVDALITHDDAARQRAPVEIGIPGRSALLTLDLQVLPATAVVEVGTILQFTDAGVPRIGIVRSVTVSYRHPTLRQSVEVECHA